LTRDDVIRQARSYIGTRYRHQGRSVRGLDCAGLIIRVAWDLGASTYDTSGYGRHSSSHDFLDKFAANMDTIAYTKVKPGDVILFRDDIFPQHCAFYSEVGRQPFIIHACARKKKVAEERMDDFWFGRRVSAFRFRGIE